MNLKLAFTITIFSTLTACSDYKIVPAHVCPSVHQWSRMEQDKLLIAEIKLQPDSILIAAINDYVRMRDEARACK